MNRYGGYTSCFMVEHTVHTFVAPLEYLGYKNRLFVNGLKNLTGPSICNKSVNGKRNALEEPDISNIHPKGCALWTKVCSYRKRKQTQLMVEISLKGTIEVLWFK